MLHDRYLPLSLPFIITVKPKLALSSDRD